jgi:hypothetical protein
MFKLLYSKQDAEPCSGGSKLPKTKLSLEDRVRDLEYLVKQLLDVLQHR